VSLALEILVLPVLACLVLAGIHAYLGLHVLARGVIFVDLAFAQVAALGMAAALLAGHALGSDAAYSHALVFTAAGAALFATVRTNATHHAEGGGGADSIPQEAIIGIVYAVAAALTVMILDRLPQGGDQIKQLLVGDVLAVTGTEVARTAAVYAGIGLVHWLVRRPLLALSFGGEVSARRAWDFLFYFTFGVVVTSSVRIAGVLLVFAYLIVPAVAGALVSATVRGRLLVGWTVGFAVSVLGLTASYRWDLPPGAAVVSTFGAVLACIAGAHGIVVLARRARREGLRALSGIAAVVAGLVAIAGAFLAAVPGADHPWLNAAETVAPIVLTTFLTEGERRTFAESHAAIARGAAELDRLRALAVDVQWGTRELDPERRERLRQFLASRGEIVAGDRLVLATLRRHARHRQRFVVGLPLAMIGATAAFGLARHARAKRRSRPVAGDVQIRQR
jgi:zinc/manganese transport system permease protein